MATTTLPTGAPGLPTGPSAGNDADRPPCPVCGERVATVEHRGTDLVVMRPCGCVA